MENQRDMKIEERERERERKSVGRFEGQRREGAGEGSPGQEKKVMSPGEQQRQEVRSLITAASYVDGTLE